MADLGDWCMVDLAHDTGHAERVAVIRRDAAKEPHAAALLGTLNDLTADARA